MNLQIPISLQLVCDADACHAIATARTTYGTVTVCATVTQEQAAALLERIHARVAQLRPTGAAAGAVDPFAGMPKNPLTYQAHLMIARAKGWPDPVMSDYGLGPAGSGGPLASFTRLATSPGVQQAIQSAAYAVPGVGQTFAIGVEAMKQANQPGAGMPGQLEAIAKFVAPSLAEVAANMASTEARKLVSAAAFLTEGAHIAAALADGDARAKAQIAQLQELASTGDRAATVALRVIERASKLPAAALHSLARSGVDRIALQAVREFGKEPHTSAAYLQAVAAFLPGIGPGAAAAYAAADALAGGQPVTAAIIGEARTKLAAPALQAAFDAGARLAANPAADLSAIDAIGARLPVTGQAAFQLALALTCAQKIQDRIRQAGGISALARAPEPTREAAPLGTPAQIATKLLKLPPLQLAKIASSPIVIRKLSAAAGAAWSRGMPPPQVRELLEELRGQIRSAPLQAAVMGGPLEVTIAHMGAGHAAALLSHLGHVRHLRHAAHLAGCGAAFDAKIGAIPAKYDLPKLGLHWPMRPDVSGRWEYIAGNEVLRIRPMGASSSAKKFLGGLVKIGASG